MKQDDLKLRYRYYLFLGASLVLFVSLRLVVTLSTTTRERERERSQYGPAPVGDSASHAFSPFAHPLAYFYTALRRLVKSQGC